MITIHARHFPGLLVTLLVAALAACAPQTPPASPTPAEPSPSPTLERKPGQVFVSERFEYTFTYPSGWIVKDKPGEWPDYDPLDPNRGAGIDAFAAYLDGRNFSLGIGARSLTEDSSLEEWMETAKALILAGVSKGVCYESAEDEPAPPVAITLSGEPAVLLEYRCPNAFDFYGLVVLSIRNGQGYWITWLSPQGNEAADQAEFTEILSTFSFTD